MCGRTPHSTGAVFFPVKRGIVKIFYEADGGCRQLSALYFHLIVHVFTHFVVSRWSL